MATPRMICSRFSVCLTLFGEAKQPPSPFEETAPQKAIPDSQLTLKGQITTPLSPRCTLRPIRLPSSSTDSMRFRWDASAGWCVLPVRMPPQQKMSWADALKDQLAGPPCPALQELNRTLLGYCLVPQKKHPESNRYPLSRWMTWPI